MIWGTIEAGGNIPYLWPPTNDSCPPGSVVEC